MFNEKGIAAVSVNGTHWSEISLKDIVDFKSSL
jgi:hypothetical protein